MSKNKKLMKSFLPLLPLWGWDNESDYDPQGQWEEFVSEHCIR